MLTCGSQLQHADLMNSSPGADFRIRIHSLEVIELGRKFFWSATSCWFWGPGERSLKSYELMMIFEMRFCGFLSIWTRSLHMRLQTHPNNSPLRTKNSLCRKSHDGVHLQCWKGAAAFASQPRPSLVIGFGGIQAVDSEFPYRVPIVDTTVSNSKPEIW